MFTTIIDSHPNLTHVEKMQHLRSCLRDAALETIRSLEISDGNYAIALDLLKNRFDNRRLVFQAHITEILGLIAGVLIAFVNHDVDQHGLGNI